MNHLKSKSDCNINSASSLITNSLYASSVHCSYYSCVQLMLHILRSDFGKTDVIIDSESKIGSKNNRGFHNWLINIIRKEYMQRNPGDSRLFYSKIGQLKKLRVNADYKNIDVPSATANNALKTAQEINSLLQTNFRA